MSLPRPAAGFRWTDEPWGPMLRCVPLEAVARHGFTSRQLGLRPGDAAPLGWASAAASVGCQASQIARVRQVHGAVVRVVRAGDQILQCESCVRILYWVPEPKAAEGETPAAADAGTPPPAES